MTDALPPAKANSSTAAETSPPFMDLPVSATCADGASPIPPSAPFPPEEADTIERAFGLPERRPMRNLPWENPREFLGDVIGAACVFLIPLFLYLLGAMFQ